VNARVVIVFPSDGGSVVRWYASEDQANFGTEIASASAVRVRIEGASVDVAADAYEVHRQLHADRTADVSWAATHRRVVDGLNVELVALERPAERGPVGRSESRQRTNMVALRLLPAERSELVAAAEERGVSLSELLRGAALDRARDVGATVTEPVPDALRRLMDANERLVADRARLTRDVELLLWLHAEARWLLVRRASGMPATASELKSAEVGSDR
jgi:uncharacterized protein (DUF1778 family)